MEVEVPGAPPAVPDASAVPDAPAVLPEEPAPEVLPAEPALAVSGVPDGAVAPSFAISADRLAENPPGFFGAALPLLVAIATALPALPLLPPPPSFEHAAAAKSVAVENTTHASRGITTERRGVTIERRGVTRQG
jgi:hypothetical protein